MYKTLYQSVNRVHSGEEGITIDIPKDATDMFLWLVDVYDLIMKKSLSDDQKFHIRRKIKEYLLLNYEKLHVPIPGCLLGWTHSMFVWIVYLSLLKPVINIPTNYIKKHKLRVYEDPDTDTWSWDVYISMLDVLALRWNDLELNQELEKLLKIMWYKASTYTLFIHTKDVLSIDNHTLDTHAKYHVRLTTESIVMCMSRFVGFERAIRLNKKWSKHTLTIPDNTYDSFIFLERRHLVTRKFRDSICKWMWDRVILIGDKDIASHDQLGEQVSAFTCLYKRNPTGQITRWQKTLTYEPYETIVQDEMLKDFVHLHFIDQHFTNIYNVNFKKFFVVLDIYKHLDAIECSTVPLLIWFQGRFDVYFSHKMYRSDNIDHAFLMWLILLKQHLDCKPYSMDFTGLYQQIFEATISDDEFKLDGHFTLLDDM